MQDGAVDGMVIADLILFVRPHTPITRPLSKNRWFQGLGQRRCGVHTTMRFREHLTRRSVAVAVSLSNHDLENEKGDVHCIVVDGRGNIRAFIGT